MKKAHPLILLVALAVAQMQCQHEDANAMAQGCTWKLGNSCYTVVESEETLFAAETACTVIYGGHLAAIDSQAEDDFMRARLLDKYGTRDNAKLWIGLVCVEGGDWMWTNGDPLAYTGGWGPNQPDVASHKKQAVYFFRDSDYLWKWAVASNVGHWYICES